MKDKNKVETGDYVWVSFTGKIVTVCNGSVGVDIGQMVVNIPMNLCEKLHEEKELV